MKKRFTALFFQWLLMFCSLSVSAADARSAAPLFEASFLQGWMCLKWTAERWEAELSAMKQHGFRSLILQSSADFTYEKTENSDGYLLVSASALFPTAAVDGSEQNAALQNALTAAKSCGMQVYIGTLSDSRWWDFGWGVPDERFSAWSAENAEKNAALIAEVWTLYGKEYADQIAVTGRMTAHMLPSSERIYAQ